MSKLFAIAALACVALPVMADTLDDFDALPTADKRQARIDDARDPSLESLIAGAAPAWALLAGSEKQKATMQIAGVVGEWALDFRLAGSIGDDEEQKILGDLNGVSAKSSASFGFSHLNWEPPAAVTAQSMVAVCTAYATELGRTFDPDSETCGEDYFSAPGSVAQDYLQQYEKLAWGTDTMRVIGARMELGRSDFKFATAADPTPQKVSKEPWSVTVYSGWILANNNSVLTAGYRYERSYEAGPKTELCTPFGTTGTLRCDEITIDPPVRGTKRVTSLEWRRIRGKVAINPSLFYDSENRETGIRVPLYFVKDLQGSFRGGVQLDWNTTDRETTISLFVGRAFTLLQ